MSAATLRPVARASCLNWRSVVSGSLTVIPFIIIDQGNSILTEWQYPGISHAQSGGDFGLSRRCDQFSESSKIVPWGAPLQIFAHHRLTALSSSASGDLACQFPLCFRHHIGA